VGKNLGVSLFMLVSAGCGDERHLYFKRNHHRYCVLLGVTVLQSMPFLSLLKSLQELLLFFLIYWHIIILPGYIETFT
jgi:hypothetical protein